MNDPQIRPNLNQFYKLIDTEIYDQKLEGDAKPDYLIIE